MQLEKVPGFQEMIHQYCHFNFDGESVLKVYLINAGILIVKLVNQ